MTEEILASASHKSPFPNVGSKEHSPRSSKEKKRSGSITMAGAESGKWSKEKAVSSVDKPDTLTTDELK